MARTQKKKKLGRRSLAGDGGETKRQRWLDQQRQDGEAHFARFDFLAEIFGRASDHQPRDEDRDDGQEQNAIKARTDTSGRDTPRQQIEQRNEAADRRQRVESGIGGASSGAGGGERKQRCAVLPEPQVLAFEVSGRWVEAKRGQHWIACRLGAR